MGVDPNQTLYCTSEPSSDAGPAHCTGCSELSRHLLAEAGHNVY